MLVTGEPIALFPCKKDQPMVRYLSTTERRLSKLSEKLTSINQTIVLSCDSLDFHLGCPL